MEPTQNDNLEMLRKICKHLMVDLDLDRPGSISIIADKLSQKLGRTISRQSVTMALTGYRETEAYHQLLTELKAILESLLLSKAA